MISISDDMFLQLAKTRLDEHLYEGTTDYLDDKLSLAKVSPMVMKYRYGNVREDDGALRVTDEMPAKEIEYSSFLWSYTNGEVDASEIDVNSKLSNAALLSTVAVLSGEDMVKDFDYRDEQGSLQNRFLDIIKEKEDITSKQGEELEEDVDIETLKFYTGEIINASREYVSLSQTQDDEFAQ